MPTLLTEPPELLTVGPIRKKWTLGECEKLAEAGLLDWERYELVEGDLIDTMGKGRRHVTTQKRLLIALNRIFGLEHIDIEAPVRVGRGSAAGSS